MLKKDIKAWSKVSFGNLELQCDNIVKEIGELDVEEVEELSQEKVQHRKQLLEDFWCVAKRHESILHKKFRVKWIKAGDDNTKNFNSVLKWRSRTYGLGVFFFFFISDRWVDDPIEVKKKVKRLLC